MIYKRILLKLSGESLMGGRAYGIDEVRLGEYAKQIKEISDQGIQIGIVIGGGNIFRGLAPPKASTASRATRWVCWPPSSTVLRSAPPSRLSA